MAQKPQKIVGRVLRRFNERLGRRDDRLASEFLKNGTLAGSEVRDLSRGRKAVLAHARVLFADPRTIQFEWQRVDADGDGETIWFFAEGQLALTSPGGAKVERSPYHLSGVLRRNAGGKWKWQLFHGAEPK